MHILVVDDIEMVLESVCKTLRRLGHATTPASSADEGCTALKLDTAFDVVLTDMRMPHGSGLDVLRACIRLAKPSPALIIMTGYASAQEITEALDLGATTVLLKPFSRRQLADALAIVNNTHQTLDILRTGASI